MNLIVLQRDSMHHPNHSAYYMTGYKYSDKPLNKIGQKASTIAVYRLPHPVETLYVWNNTK